MSRAGSHFKLSFAAYANIRGKHSISSVADPGPSQGTMAVTVAEKGDKAFFFSLHFMGISEDMSERSTAPYTICHVERNKTSRIKTENRMIRSITPYNTRWSASQGVIAL